MTTPLESIEFTRWMSEGHLHQYVRGQRFAGGCIAFESAQPAGDMSDPPTDSFVLIETLSPLIRHRSDFGSGVVTADDSRGTLYVVPPHVSTHIEVHDHHVIRSFAFPESRFGDAIREYLPTDKPFDLGWLHKRGFRSAGVSRLADRIWQDAADPSRANALASHGQALQMIAALHQLARGPAKPASGGLSAWAQRRCIDYLQAHLDQDVTLDDLSAIAGLSPFHFSRMFKMSTGMSPSAYLRHLRVEQAKHLLARSNLSIEAIAMRVGFATPQAFARMFRAETGRTPTAFRH